MNLVSWGMASASPRSLFMQVIAEGGNVAGKKKSTGEGSAPERNGAGNRRRNVQKGGFAVYRIVDLKDVSMADEEGQFSFGDAKQALVRAKAKDGTFAEGLADTTDAIKWIREHGAEFNGANLLIVQEKRQVKPVIERIEKVVLET